MQQFLDYMGTFRGGRRFVTLEEERDLLQTGTSHYGMTFGDTRSALLVGARQSNLVLESEVADEVSAFLSARLRRGDRVTRADFGEAVDFFSMRAGNSVSQSEAEQRVRQLMIRNGWAPARSGWLWPGVGWFDRIPDPAPRSVTPPLGPVAGPIADPVIDAVPPSAIGDPRMMNGDPGPVLEAWAAALRSRNVQRIIALYTPDALLMATAEQRPLIGPPQIRTYFDRLTSYEGLNVTFQEELQRLNADRASLISGLYTFSWIDPASGAQVVTPARYSFAVRNLASGPQGRISMHHSSHIPGNYPGADQI